MKSKIVVARCGNYDEMLRRSKAIAQRSREPIGMRFDPSADKQPSTFAGYIAESTFGRSFASTPEHKALLARLTGKE